MSQLEVNSNRFEFQIFFSYAVISLSIVTDLPQSSSDFLFLFVRRRDLV